MRSDQSAELVHRQIVVNMTIRTLERDRKHLSVLKMNQSFDLWMDLKVKELKELLRQIKSDLSRQGIKILKEKVIDEFITSYTILERGMEYERKYNNIALKNWCLEEVKRLLGLEYRTSESGKQKP